MSDFAFSDIQYFPEFGLYTDMYGQYLATLFIWLYNEKILKNRNSAFEHFLGIGTLIVIKNVVRFNKVFL